MRSTILFFLSTFVAALLSYSAFTHLENGFHFLHSVLSYRLVNPSLALVIAALAPFIQLLLAIVLLFDRDGRSGSFVACGLIFFGYTIAQMTALVRGLNISCGCFGGGDESPIGFASVGLAAGCMTASLLGWWLTRKTLEGST